MTNRRRALLAMLSLLAVLVWALPAGATEEVPPVSENDAPGVLQVINVISSLFSLPTDEVAALHEQGVGFGALFKLQLLARAQNKSVAELIAAATGPDGEIDFAFGQAMHQLTPEQLALIEGLPKNLGQAVAAMHRSDHAAQGNGHGRGNGHGNGHGH